MMNFNLEKAINDEEYARNILINEDIYYDDYIFILSTIYSSNIDIKYWLQAFQNNEKLFNNLIQFACVSHCLDWEENINDTIEIAKLEKCKNNINLNDSNNYNFKEMNISREWVKNNISRKLLTIFKNNNKIEDKDVFNILKNL